MSEREVERQNVVVYLRRRAGDFRRAHRLIEAMAIDDMAREVEDHRHYRAAWDEALYKARCIWHPGDDLT